MARKKRMTVRERDERRAVKKHLQEQGLVPPDKPKLNRKRYVEEAREEWDNRPKDCYIWEMYLMQAFGCMLGKTEGRSLRVSQEAVGAAKVLKLALRLRQFHAKLKEEGKTKYSLSEEYDYIKDILDA